MCKTEKEEDKEKVYCYWLRVTVRYWLEKSKLMLLDYDDN